RLVDTYAQVVKSNRVLDAVAERMAKDYPGIQPSAIGASLSMTGVSETSVVRVSSRTGDAKLSADIVNAVLDVAPGEIKRVVGAGDIEIIDYASPPSRPDARPLMRQGLTGALAGAVAAAAVLFLFFVLNQRVGDAKELRDNYTLPVLSSVKRQKGESEDPTKFVLSGQSDMDLVESYAKLRMNLLYTLVGKERKSVVVTSAVSGEGKSTIASNLAISLAMAGKRVLLVDADMRRGCQHEIFGYSSESAGLSNVLIGQTDWHDALRIHRVGAKPEDERNPEPEADLQYKGYPVTTTDAQPQAAEAPEGNTLDVLPSGTVPPNPSELLGSAAMGELLRQMEAEYDLVLLDAPPINIVSDPLALSAGAAGGIFVVRQDFTDHREIRRALNAAEMTGLELLGFVFYGEKVRSASYYSYRRYGGYHGYHSYDKYDTRNRYDPRNRYEPKLPARKPELKNKGETAPSSGSPQSTPSESSSRRRRKE
ncbi:MAG: AAA family ATPase, partial [Clostridia bacterium]|nr:AAA family ATPase [Clostridia bacterium]